MKIKLENLVSITESNVGKKRDKIQHGFYKEISILNCKGQAPCRFRFYDTGQTIHCIAWLSGNEHYTSGYGKAGGYGYCKESAAMESAIIDSGIKMDRYWGGSGDISMREAAFSIAKKLDGNRKFIMHTAHA